jgi:carbonic anhydrase
MMPRLGKHWLNSHHMRRNQSRRPSLERSPLRKSRHFSKAFFNASADALYSVEDSVREDVALLRASSWISKDTQIIGLKYDISTGELFIVEESKSEL